jgi:3-methyladenine DNA glycosylase/8-oxoguanine DNA glycosylase
VTLLRLPEPYSFDLSTERFRRFGPDLANCWHEGAVWRWLDGREVRITPAEGGVVVEPAAQSPVRGSGPGEGVRGNREVAPVTTAPWFATARVLLGAPFDLDAFYASAVTDPVLADLVARFAGFRPPLSPDPFEMLVHAITAQQVSLMSATAIRNRMLRAYGEHGAVAIRFPTREELGRASADDLFALGFSRRKAEYILSLAHTPLDWDELAALPDGEVKARLTALRGIGEWTADWFLARHLARPRAWPAGDLALRKAVARFYPDLGADVRAAGERFAPFENLTAHYLLLAARTL